MNVSLTPELAKFVKAKVDGGDYPSASEVIREGLRLLREQDHDRQARREAMRAKIAEGIEALQRGERLDGDAVFRELELRNRIAIGVEQVDRGEVASLDFEAIKAEGRRRLAEQRGTPGTRAD